MNRGLWLGVCAALAATALWAGCGGIRVKDDTPDGLLDSLLQLIRAGQYDRAAELFDYNQEALKKNPDWYTFSSTQRYEIVEKMREDRALMLSDWARRQDGLEQMTTKLLRVRGDTASGSIIAGDREKVRVKMRKVEDKWRLSDFHPL